MTDKVAGTRSYVPHGVFHAARYKLSLHLDFCTPEDLERASKHVRLSIPTIRDKARPECLNTEHNFKRIEKLNEYFDQILKNEQHK